MKTKHIITLSLAVSLSIFILFFALKGGFKYYFGFGTSYSYFEAQKATSDKILVIYIDSNYYLREKSIDSLQFKFGFTSKMANENLSNFALKIYNNVIYKELKCRLGLKKWNEYKSKVDSIQKLNTMRIIY